MSISFIAMHSVRLDRLDNPVLVELNGLLDAMTKSGYI